MATATEVGQKLEQKTGEMKSFIEARRTEHGLDFQGDDLQAFNDRNAELKALNAEYAALSAADLAARDMQSSVNRAPLFGAFGGEQAQRAAIKSLGEQFTESPSFAAYMANKSLHGNEKLVIEVKGDLAEVMGSNLKANITTATSVVPYPQMGQMVPAALRRPVVADLIPQTPTDNPMVMFAEEVSVNLNAAAVAEGAVKPLSDFTTERRIKSVEVIAHRFKVSNQALEDIPGIQDQLNRLGTLGLLLAEEDAILNGTGTSPQIEGLLPKTGVQTQARGSSDPLSAFLQAFTKVQVTGRALITGGVVNPFDWQKIVLQKDTTGRFIFGDPYVTEASKTLFGKSFVVTDAITEGTALVGDFANYVRLRRKGGIRVIVGYSGDDIDRNLQTIVVEERIALEIYRAAAFCKVTGLNTLSL